MPEWVCAACGGTHDELPAATLSAPDAWFCSSEEERAAEFDLTADTCVWRDEHFFVRCVLQLPLLDREGSFDFGVWSTLSQANFDRYLESLDYPDSLGPDGMFGWLSNRLPGYPDTTNLKCLLHPKEAGKRPKIELEPTSHPLSLQQRRGIAFEEAVAYLHEHMDF